MTPAAFHAALVAAVTARGQTAQAAARATEEVGG